MNAKEDIRTHIELAYDRAICTKDKKRAEQPEHVSPNVKDCTCVECLHEWHTMKVRDAAATSAELKALKRRCEWKDAIHRMVVTDRARANELLHKVLGGQCLECDYGPGLAKWVKSHIQPHIECVRCGTPYGEGVSLFDRIDRQLGASVTYDKQVLEGDEMRIEGLSISSLPPPEPLPLEPKGCIICSGKMARYCPSCEAEGSMKIEPHIAHRFRVMREALKAVPTTLHTKECNEAVDGGKCICHCAIVDKALGRSRPYVKPNLDTIKVLYLDEVASPRCTTRPTRDDVEKLIEFVRCLKNAHDIDIKMRKDARDYWYEGDWLKYLEHYLELALADGPDERRWIYALMRFASALEITPDIPPAEMEEQILLAITGLQEQTATEICTRCDEECRVVLVGPGEKVCLACLSEELSRVKGAAKAVGTYNDAYVVALEAIGGNLGVTVPARALPPNELQSRMLLAIEALREQLPHPENPGQTHYEGCHTQRGHHNCAVRIINESNEMMAAAQQCITKVRAELGMKLGDPTLGALPERVEKDDT